MSRTFIRDVRAVVLLHGSLGFAASFLGGWRSLPRGSLWLVSSVGFPSPLWLPRLFAVSCLGGGTSLPRCPFCFLRHVLRHAARPLENRLYVFFGGPPYLWDVKLLWLRRGGAYACSRRPRCRWFSSAGLFLLGAFASSLEACGPGDVLSLSLVRVGSLWCPLFLGSLVLGPAVLFLPSSSYFGGPPCLWARYGSSVLHRARGFWPGARRGGGRRGGVGGRWGCGWGARGGGWLLSVPDATLPLLGCLVPAFLLPLSLGVGGSCSCS